MEPLSNDHLDISDSDFRKDYLEGGGRRDSWKAMFDHLSSDMGVLMSRQKDLVKAEVKEKLLDFKEGVISIVVAGVFLFVGLLALVATSIIFLSEVMDLSTAAGIVTIFLLVLGTILLLFANKKLTAEKLVPKQSIETFGRMTSTFKERINEYKSNSHH